MASNLNLILNCFENLDAAGLEILLHDENTYSDVSKQAFLIRLQAFFDDFKAGVVPNEKLQIFPGACCNKSCDHHLGRTAFRFLGAMGVYFDLRFIVAKDFNGLEYVKDIYTCYDLITNEKVDHLHESTFFWVYEDDKVTTTLKDNHDLLVKQAEDALASYNLYFDVAIVSLVEVKSWLDLHETTYFEIGGFKEDLLIHWKWDKFLRIYHDIKKLIVFLADFESDFDKMFSIRENAIPEDQLLRLVLDWESRLENDYTELYGSIFHFQKVYGGFEVKIRLQTKIKLEDLIIEKADEFLDWFDKQRDRLLLKYFSFTRSELEEFEETTKSVLDLYKVRKSLNFHIEIREKFKKNGIYIPFDLGHLLGIPFFGSS